MRKAIIRIFALALVALPCATVAGVITSDSVVSSTGTLVANGNNWTASSLVYLTPDGNDSLNRSEAGWYAGIRRTWALSSSGSGLIKTYSGTQANAVKASFSDNAGRSLAEYDVYNILGTSEQSPDGSGIKNDSQLGGVTRYMKTTDWNVWVTPEMMNTLRKETGAYYTATLTIGGETYTITVPQTVQLTDGDGTVWYPAVAEIDGKVYGDMGRAVAAGVTAAASGKGMEFYVEPTGYPASVNVVKVGGVWKLELATSVPLNDAVVELSATEVIERDAPIEIEIASVTLGGLALVEGRDYEIAQDSVLTAQARGDYTVKITGIGSYSGEATATWKILEPTGEFAEDALSAAPGYDACGAVDSGSPRRFSITNTTSLVYVNDADGERWQAQVQIRWPHEVTEYGTYWFQQIAAKVQYTDAKHAAVAVSDEDIAFGDAILDGEWDCFSAKTGKASYYILKGISLPEQVEYEYFDTLTWTVPLYADDVKDAIESGAKHLEFSITCSSVAWGDETEGDVSGIEDTEFTVSLSLAKVFLLNDKGEQVFPAHEHDWNVELSGDGSSLTAGCLADGCYLRETIGKVSLALVSKDARDAAYADGHYRDGKASEAILDGAAEFVKTGGTIGEVQYFTADGAALDSAPVEIGEYYAVCSVALPGSGGNAELRRDGLRILAGEAVMDGVHVPDAATYFERATGSAMNISAGRSYTAAKTYVIPAKYGSLGLLDCGEKRYDLAGFAITAPVDGALFENNGRLVISDSVGTGSISANAASESDEFIINRGTLTIEGGTFYGSLSNETGSVTITGGKFSVKPEADYVAEGYDLVRRGRMWSVEKHEHKYIVHSVGGRLLVATCANILADGSLQVSHCSGRMLVGVVGIRQFGLIPLLSVDYDRKEHPAEFYAINLTGVADLLSADGLLDALRIVIESDPLNLDAAGVLELLGELSANADLADVLGKVGNVFVNAGEFEEMTGVTLGEISYMQGGEPIEGAPVEPGRYDAVLEVETANGNTYSLKGTYTINEKELPIETEGHLLHLWTYSVDGAKVTATCPGNLIPRVECNASPMALELVPSAEGGRKVYDAQPLEVVVSNLNTFVINTDAKVSDVSYETADGEVLDGAPVEPGSYTAKITVTSGLLVRREATLDLTIEEKAPERDFPIKPWTRHVGSGDSSLVVGEDVLYYPVEFAWPYMIEQIVFTPRFTDPDHARITISTADDPFTGADLLDGAGEEYGLAAEAGEFFRIKKFANQTYMKRVAWNVPFTFAEIDAARAAGETEIVRTITLEGKCGEDDLAGLKPATCTLILDVENLVVTDDEGRQIYPVHKHSWTAQNTGAALTLTCETDECPQAPGLTAELYTGFEARTYNTLPAVARLSGAEAMRIHADVVFGEIAYVELGDGGAEYPLGSAAPSVPGRYRAEVDYSDGAAIVGSLAIEFEILPLDAEGMTVYFADPRTLFFYSGEEQGPGIAGVWYGPVPLKYGVDFEIEGEYKATDVGEYAFAVVGKGKFEGRQSFSWRIAEPVRPFAPDALKIPGGPCAPRWGEIGKDGQSVVAVASSNIVYDAKTERWVAPLTIDWPFSGIDGVFATPPIYTDPAHAKIETDCGDVILVTSIFKRPRALLPEESVVKVLWMPSFTMDDVKTAFDAGLDELVFEITVGSTAWACDPFGLKTTTYKLVVPIKGLIADDGTNETVVDWYWVEYLGNGATSGEMAIERRLSFEPARLTDCAYRKKDFNLLGWSFDAAAQDLAALDFADRQVVSDEFTVGVTNSIYAVWTKDIVLSGDITGEDGATPESVVAWGAGSTVDDAVEGRLFGNVAPWRYVVVVPSKGSYDVVVTAESEDGDKTTTTVLVIGASDSDSARKSNDVVPGAEGTSSTVDNSGSGNYPVVVGGLDDIARKTRGQTDSGSQVEIRFTVTEMPAAPSTVGYARIREEVPSGCAKPLDFTLARYIDGVLDEKLHDLTEFGGLVTVVMPFKANGRRNVKVVRYHEETEGDASTGSVCVLPQGTAHANENGECFDVDDDGGELLVRGAKLSTYAILWDGAEVSAEPLVWHVDWLSGMYVPEIELEVKEGLGWASTVTNMSFLLEKRPGVQLWDARTNKAVANIVTKDGVEFYKVSLKDRFAEKGIDGADSAVWGAVWYDANWINAALSEILLYAPQYWPTNPKDVDAINDMIAYVAYESCECESYVRVGANQALMMSLSAVAPKVQAAPAAVSRLNATLAVGAPVTVENEPYCRLAGFAVEDGVVSGMVEVGAGAAKGSLGATATVVVLGAKDLAAGFEPIGTAVCDAEGRFSVRPPDGCKFFKVSLSYGERAK